jgi:hypothetical protein
MGPGMTVQQDDRRTGPSRSVSESDIADIRMSELEAVKHSHDVPATDELTPADLPHIPRPSDPPSNQRSPNRISGVTFAAAIATE